MAETQVSKSTNGAQVTPAPVVESASQSTIIELLARIKELEAKNAANEKANQFRTAGYDVMPPSEDYPTPSLKLSIPSAGRPIIGGRAKITALLNEFKSGRVEEFLAAHPEIK